MTKLTIAVNAAIVSSLSSIARDECRAGSVFIGVMPNAVPTTRKVVAAAEIFAAVRTLFLGSSKTVIGLL